MLTVVFQHAAEPSSESLKPLAALRMEGNLIREKPGGPVLARHRDHRWELNGKKYFRLDCADLVYVQMENESGVSARYGPFTHFSSADGLAFAEREQFAQLDEATGLWSCSQCEGTWRALIVTPATHP